MEQHYHMTTVAPDGTYYETCGFWEDEGQARDAILDAYPEHVVAAVEQTELCTA